MVTRGGPGSVTVDEFPQAQVPGNPPGRVAPTMHLVNLWSRSQLALCRPRAKAFTNYCNQPLSRATTSTVPSQPRWVKRMPYGPEPIKRPDGRTTRRSYLPGPP